MCDSSGCGGGGDGCSGGADGDWGVPKALRAAGPPGDMPMPCMKCKEQPWQVVVRNERLCHDCLAAQLQAKVHGAIKLRGLIGVGDAVALAFSGGATSAALLHFLAALRNPRTDRLARGKVAFTLHIMHVDESAAQGADPDQAAAVRGAVRSAAEQYLGEGVQYHCVPLESVFEQEEPDPERRRERLRQLLEAVPDATGREDLVAALRTRVLLGAATAVGCAKVARGDCATRLAAHIVAAAAKGCGHGLAGDVQLVDARHSPAGPLFFYPLREVGKRELALLCQHKQLPTVGGLAEGAAALGQQQAQRPGASGSGAGGSINGLAAAFVEGLLAHNPGSVSNMLSTISKLQAFPWNDPPDLHNRHTLGRLKNQQKAAAAAAGVVAERGADGEAPQQPQQQLAGRQWQEVLCPICLAPLADDELAAPSQPASLAAGATTAAAGGSNSGSGEAPCSPPTAASSGSTALQPPLACCLSCRSQILGLGPAVPQASNSGGTSATAEPGSRVAGLLPEAVRQQMQRLAAAEGRAASQAAHPDQGQVATAERLRGQIAEFLLDDD